MIEKSHVIHLVDEMIDSLSRPLAKEDTDVGWSDESRQAILNLFKRLRLDLEKAGIPDSTEYLTVARGLDHWGITDGRLLMEAVGISGALRALLSYKA